MNTTSHPMMSNRDRLSAAPQIELPQVSAPSLEGLVLTQPPIAAITEADLSTRLDALRYAHARRIPRDPQERVELGDEVVVQLVGYYQGKVVPFSIRSAATIWLTPETAPGGLCEGLVGTGVGESALIKIAEHPDSPPMVFAAYVWKAAAIELPEVDSPEFLAALGRGDSLEAVLRSLLTAEIDARARVAWIQAAHVVLKEVVRRAHVDIPMASIEKAVWGQWWAAEGQTLKNLGASPEEQESSLAAWLSNTDLVEDLRERLSTTAVLQAIARRDGVGLGEAEVSQLGKQLSQQLGAPAQEVFKALEEEPALSAQLAESVAYMQVVLHVVGHASISPPLQ